MVIKKFSPPLQFQQRVEQTHIKTTFVIAVSSTDRFIEFLRSTPGILLMYEYAGANVFLLQCSWKDLLNKILPRPEVIFIDQLRVPKEEVAVSNLDLSANKSNIIHSRFPQYNGNALGVSVKENRPDTADIDFKGRYLTSPFVSTALSNHATIMSTIIAGAGNTYYEGRGVANGAVINSVNFTNLLPEPDTYYQQFNVTVQNHSYGTGIENYYGADAAAYDASVALRPPLVHVFSAGNSGLQTSATGVYATIPGYANITGSFKMAKNIITVGHTDSFGIVLPASSKGPAFDGRVKPDLVAFGEDGSSGAAAIVSGISLTVQQAYKDVNGNLPSAALVKAVLINSADDAGVKGPDFNSGYGSANAWKAVQAIVHSNYFNGTINNGGTNSHPVTVPDGCKQLKITLVWNDPPAAANAIQALRNDLDLELALVSTGETWKPWVLNHVPHIDSLQQLPVRKRDSLNNTEQVTIDLPVAGNYSITIRGFNVTTTQSYFIAYQFDTLDKFSWQYPTKQDNIFSGTTNVLRWTSTYATATGQLQYSINNGSSWQTINNTVDLSKGYFKWNAPDTLVTALLRMNFASQDFRSDIFTVSKRFSTFVGFNCPDSFSFYWNKLHGVSSYQVYRLGPFYIEPLLVTSDTLVMLGKQANPSLWYAVAPLLGNKTGLRTNAFNYTTQGTGCYIRSFLVQMVGTTGVLELVLGTPFGVKTITWEKLSLNGYKKLQSFTTVSGLIYSYTDNTLQPGLNTYRVKIELVGGQIIYSLPETLYHFNDSQYIVYPNPVTQSQPFTILSNDPGTGTVQVFNSIGEKLYEKKLNDLVNIISTDRLSKGLYFLRFLKENKQQILLKVVIN